MSSRPNYMSNYMHPMARSWLARILIVLVTLMLTGCIGQMAYMEGKDQVAQGNAEEGLARFREALVHEPRNAEYKAAYIRTRDSLVAGYIDQANRMSEAGKRSEAEKLYQRALILDPDNNPARAGLRKLETGERHVQLLKEAEAAWAKKDTDSAMAKLQIILAENPNHPAALALKRRMVDPGGKLAGQVELSSAYKKPITIEFKDVALKQVFEVISLTSGLNFLFDKDVKTDQKTSIYLKNSTIEAAVHFTLLTNQLEQQILDNNTILIYPNTPAKLKDYQEMVVKSFFLANADAKSVANTLKTIVKTRDIVIDEKLNMLIVRDSPEAIKVAEKLVALQDVPEPEVMLEVEILEVTRGRLLELGIRWPSNVALTPLPANAADALTLRDLRGLNSGTIGATLSPVTINARKEDSGTNILANPRIRARNHEKAKILIGDRFPNITTTSTSTNFISETITYVDVGLKLEVEPTIYLDNDVAIKISLEVSNIVNQVQTKSGSLAYQIGTRTASTVLRLKDGENQILAGLINDQDRRSANKVPGLGEIPILGRLFGSGIDDSTKSEIVLSITPHLIRNIQRPEAAQSEFKTGTDSSFRVRPESVSYAGPAAAANSLANPAAQPKPLTGQPVPPAPSPATPPPATPPTQNPPSGPAELRWQGPAEVKVGDTVTLQLTMQSDQPITSLPMAIGFDKRVLQIMNIGEGDFLKQSGAQTSFNSRVAPNGQILLTATRSGEGGATSSGTVATIVFRALAPANNSRIELLTVAPIGVAGSAVTARVPAPYQLQIK